MTTPWWQAFGLRANPMGNHPVDEGHPELLVWTAAITNLSHSLKTPNDAGSIFLLNGGYGSGKTTVLHALHHLVPQDGPWRVYYHDLSLCKQRPELVAEFKKIADEAAATQKAGRRALFGLDQLHNLDTTIVGEFFKDYQSKFEEFKRQGVRLVFAGDERFSSLVRTAGPLGAIFDEEFDLLAFDHVLAREMLDRRCKQNTERPGSFASPLSDDAVAELVRRTKGNPRDLVDHCKAAMKHASDRAPPILVGREDVLAASAELTPEFLTIIRNELRSPATGNFLSKVTKLHDRPDGAALVHDLARLLDASLSSPAATLNALAASLPGLGIRPDLLVEAADSVGITEQHQQREKGTYGSRTVAVSTLSKPMQTALLRIRRETGLPPSSFVQRVSRDYLIGEAPAQGDLMLADLRELASMLGTQRARTFIERAVTNYSKFREDGLGERDVVEITANLLRGISLGVLNNSIGDLKKAAMELAPVLGDKRDLERITPHLEKLEELRILYEARGLDWTTEQFGDARKCTVEVLRFYCSQTLDYLRRQNLPDSSYADSMANLVKEARTALRALGRPHATDNLDERISQAAASIVATGMPLAPGYLDLMKKALAYVDATCYQQAREAERRWIGQLYVEAIEALMKEGTSRDFDTAIKMACNVFKHVMEQVPSALQGKPTAQPLGKAVKNRLTRAHPIQLHSEAARSHFDIMERQELHKTFHGAISKIRATTDWKTFEEYGLVIWYLLRNAVSHSETALGLEMYRGDLAPIFGAAMAGALRASLSHAPFAEKSMVRLTEAWKGSACLVESSLPENELAFTDSSSPVRVGQIWLARRTKQGARGMWWLDRPAVLGELQSADEGLIGLSPIDVRTGCRSLRLADVMHPSWKSTLIVKRMRLGGKKTPVCEYGASGTVAPVDFPSGADVSDSDREWLQSAADAHYFIVAWSAPVANSRILVVPLLAHASEESAREGHKQMTARPHGAASLRATTEFPGARSPTAD